MSKVLKFLFLIIPFITFSQIDINKGQLIDSVGTPTLNGITLLNGRSGIMNHLGDLKYWDGDSWELIGSGGGGGLSNIIEDLTPQLGGDFDLNGFNIVSDIGFTGDGAHDIGTASNRVGDVQAISGYFNFITQTAVDVITFAGSDGGLGFANSGFRLFRDNDRLGFRKSGVSISGGAALFDQNNTAPRVYTFPDRALNLGDIAGEIDTEIGTGWRTGGGVDNSVSEADQLITTNRIIEVNSADLDFEDTDESLMTIQEDGVDFPSLTATVTLQKDPVGPREAAPKIYIDNAIATVNPLIPADIGTTDKTLTASDFGKFNYSNDSNTYTVDNSVPIGSRAGFQPTDIDAVFTFLPDTGVSFVGNGTGVITEGFQLDSLNREIIMKIADNQYSVGSYIKPYSPLVPGIYDTANAIADLTGNEADATLDIFANNGNGTVGSIAATGSATGSFMMEYDGVVTGGNQVYIRAPSGAIANTTYDISMDVSCNCSGAGVDFRADTSDGWTANVLDPFNNDDGTWEQVTMTITTDGSTPGTNVWRIRLSINSSFADTHTIHFDNIRWAAQ